MTGGGKKEHAREIFYGGRFSIFAKDREVHASGVPLYSISERWYLARSIEVELPSPEVRCRACKDGIQP